MVAKCIENNFNNTNFVKEKEYEITENGIRCEWGGMWIENPHPDVSVGTVFDFAGCKFEVSRK